MLLSEVSQKMDKLRKRLGKKKAMGESPEAAGGLTR